MGIFERIAPWLGKQLQMPSGGFGRVLGRLMAREHRALNDWAIPQLGIQAGDRVLDVGCGSGVLVRLISGLVPQGFVAGIDHSPTMVRQSLGLNAAGVADGNVSISLGEVENLHFKDESFDKVSAVETFIFWRDPLGGLREILRVLRPGGRLAVVLDATKESPQREKLEASAEALGHQMYSGSEIADLARSAGFSDATYTLDADRGRGWLCVQAVK